MPRTEFVRYNTGSVLYAKPSPLTSSPWSTGVITATENGTTGEYAIAALDESTPYTVFVRAGGSPASTDIAIAQIDRAPTNAGNMAAQLDRIEAKTTLLGSANVSVLALVTPTGEIASPIIIGDDYLESNGRAFEWTVPAVPGMTIGNVTFHFGGKPVTGGSGWLVQGEVSDAGGGNWKVSADLPRSATANLSEGQYRWSGEIRDGSGNEVTRIKNDSKRYVELVAKQT